MNVLALDLGTAPAKVRRPPSAARLEKARLRMKAWYQQNRDVARANGKRWYKANAAAQKRKASERKAARPEHYKLLGRAAHLKKKFGLTLADYDALLLAQGGVCFTCGHPPKVRPLDVDHCHKTMRIRGLLCHKCNRGLGLFSTREALVRATEYWDRETGHYAPRKKRVRKVVI